jgi:hypothetical protein
LAQCYSSSDDDRSDIEVVAITMTCKTSVLYPENSKVRQRLGTEAKTAKRATMDSVGIMNDKSKKSISQTKSTTASTPKKK